MKPTGWFQIGWSDDVGPGQVRTLRYFGQELVAYRGASGAVSVLDAYCEHLGAHLGYGGTVHGDDIECPFHGWRWNAQGRNVCIPYQDRVSKARRIRTWPVVERNGVLYIWHDICNDGAGREPLYDVPQIFTLFEASGPEVDYLPPADDGRMLRSATTVHPQYVLENGVDFAHFKYVHGADELPELQSQHFDDWAFRTTMRLRFHSRRRPGEFVTGGVQVCNLGVSLGYAYAWGSGRVCSLTAVTPVDDEVSDLRFTAWVSRDGDSEQRLSDRQRSAVTQAKADLGIWEHQRFTEPPALATAEAAGFRSMRRWARRFYPDAAVDAVGAVAAELAN